MANATLTLSIPVKLKKEMGEFPEINWSEVTRGFLAQRVVRLEALRKLDKILKNSELSKEDVERIGVGIKAGIAKAHKGKLKMQVS